MKLKLAIMTLVGVFVFGASTFADIYRWTDENSVVHYSNHSPPPDAVLVVKDEEIPIEPEVETQPSTGELETLLHKKQETLEAELAESNLSLQKVVEKVERLTEELAEANRETQRAIRRAEDLEDQIHSREVSEPAQFIYVEREYVPVAGYIVGRYPKKHHKAVPHRRSYYNRAGRKHHDDNIKTKSFYPKDRLKHVSGIHHPKRHHKAVPHIGSFNNRAGRKHHVGNIKTKSFSQKDRLRHASGIHPGRKQR